jgi:hypothetical protein
MLGTMLNQGFDTRRTFGMAHGAWHVALLSPSTIAIHDDGNVLWQSGQVLYGHELNASKAVRARYRHFAQKRSFRLSNENDKFGVLHGSYFVLGKCKWALFNTHIELVAVFF